MNSKKLQFSLDIILLPIMLLLAVYYLNFGNKINAFVLLLAIAYLFTALFGENLNFFKFRSIFLEKNKSLINFFIRYLLIYAIIFLIVFLPLFGEISARMTDKNYNLLRVHDGVVQSEVAAGMLLSGKNPYAENYFGTEMEKRHAPDPKNPSLYHFVYLPFQVISFVPFVLLADFFHYKFDGRTVFLLAGIAFLFLLPMFAKKTANKFSLLILFFINPLTIYAFQWGHNDLFVFFWMALSFYFLINRKLKLSMVIIAFSVALKQTVWPFLPLYFILFLDKDFSWVNIRTKLIEFWPFWLTTAIFYVPFIVWNLPAFWASTIGYLTGTTENSFFIAGMGISTLFKDWGLENFPFWLLQLGFGLPLLFLFINIQRKSNNLKTSLMLFSLLTFVILFFARYFFYNHLFILIWVAMIAFFAEYRISKTSKVYSVQ